MRPRSRRRGEQVAGVPACTGAAVHTYGHRMAPENQLWRLSPNGAGRSPAPRPPLPRVLDSSSWFWKFLWAGPGLCTEGTPAADS